MKPELFEDFDFTYFGEGFVNSNLNETTNNETELFSIPQLFNESEFCSDIVLDQDLISFPQISNAEICNIENAIPKKNITEINNLSDQELQACIDSNYKDTPMVLNDEIPNLFFRWLKSPPKRVNAVSPSKLQESSKPGSVFSLSLEVIAFSDGCFVPCTFVDDMIFVVQPCGRKRQKEKGKILPVKSGDLVVLDKNPIGKPLLIEESKENSTTILSVLKKGESIFSFDNLTLTCGSNAARSKNAPDSARKWDWDYYLKVEPLLSSSTTEIRPIISDLVTTDSNRSQTREKRKRPFEDVLPPAKRQALHYNISCGDYFQNAPNIQPIATFSPFQFNSFPALPEKVNFNFKF